MHMDAYSTNKGYILTVIFFFFPLLQEEQFPCHLGAFIVISKRKQNAELGIWQVSKSS